MHERRYNRAVERLRDPERVARMEVERVVSLALEGLEGVGTVLDIGTGSGLFAEQFAGRGLDVAGVDANPEMLRAAQGFFNAAATVVAMAFIRDRFVGADASRLISRLMLVIGVAPLFAPSVGGFIAGQWGWRAVFVALALFGVVLWLAVWWRLPETLPPASRRVGGVRTALAGYGRLVRDRQFVALALIPGLTSAVLMSYVSTNTRLGRHAYAIGGNREAARLSGINIKRTILTIYVTMGALMGVSGIALAAYVGHADKPAYFILLEWEEGRVRSIRDFRYIPYIAREAEFEVV